ncbi:DUF1648 domain-containing protein [Spirosoma aerolatum]|uniref:DUF1648 domain-containing protein n=1 Tax=Spirosoma aerolatum TaxID=1211326 RepID=UPI0009AEF3CF|nr:DUF1648 domain-containing protein [Spirosoma aerolatum]
MSIKLKVQLLSYALTGLPILAIALVWNRLPDRLPLHFDEHGQADQFGTRQQWLTNLVWSLFLLNLLRRFFMYWANRQQNLRAKQRVILCLLTAGFLTGVSFLLIAQGVWGVSLYQQWTPVLFFLLGSGLVYYSVPPDLPLEQKEPHFVNLTLVRQLANRQRMHMLSRLVTVRVNLLAVLIMVFVPGQDRWSVGILANLLAVVGLAGLSIYLRRNDD